MGWSDGVASSRWLPHQTFINRENVMNFKLINLLIKQAETHYYAVLEWRRTNTKQATNLAGWFSKWDAANTKYQNAIKKAVEEFIKDVDDVGMWE